jgi:hypothetical protein
MKDSPLHSNLPGPMSHLLSQAMLQWLCPCPVSLSLAATATTATASLVPSLQPSPAAAAPPRPACRAQGPRDAAAAPCAWARSHHPMQALPGDEEGGAAPRRHPPTRPDGEEGGAAGGPQPLPEPLSRYAAPLATRHCRAPLLR